MNTQHGFKRIGFSASAGFGIERLDQAQQTCPGHNLIHLGEEAFAACLLALAGIFEIGKAHLAHGRLGSGGRAILAYPVLVRRIPKVLLCKQMTPPDQKFNQLICQQVNPSPIREFTYCRALRKGSEIHQQLLIGHLI